MRQRWLCTVVVAIASVTSGCADDVDEGTGAGGAGGAGGGGDGSCSVAEPCPAQDVCVFSQGSCDPAARGSCQGAFSCDGPPTGPVCGCDGVVVEGEYAVCGLWGDGQPYDNPAPCATGTFACGALACVRHVEVCVATIPGVQGAETTYDCIPLSQVQGSCQHGIADCECMDLSSFGGASCAADADHQETITVALP